MIVQPHTSSAVSASTSAAPDLVLEKVGKTFPARRGQGEVEALRDISGVVPRNSFISILGPSGCGKSTLLDIIAGLTRPTSGEVQLEGEPIAGPSDGIAVVFQEDSTLPWRTVLENVEFPLEIAGVPKRVRAERAAKAVATVGLSSFAQARPGELSGGMRQRVAIARALVGHPKLLLMDEPFGALDQQTRLTVAETLRGLWAELGQTIVFITHDINEAAYLGTEVWLLSRRPSVVRTRLEVPWAHEPDLADVLKMPEFAELTGHVWELLRDEAKQAMVGDEPPEAVR